MLVLAGGYTSTFLSERSSEERVDLWSSNASEIAHHPFGVGIGATGSAAEKVAELREVKDESFQPDNYYFKTAIELGVVGLWIFVLFLIAAFGSASAAGRVLTGTDAALADGVAAMVLAAVAVSAVATYFEVYPLDAYFWMLLGVVGTCATESR
jgi:O-antigen ligase